MKKLPLIVLSSLVTPVAMGDIYMDPVGDIATGNANLDITQVEVTDNGTDLIVRLTVDNLDGDWGKYLFFGDYWSGGSGDNDNPWFRDISGLSGTDLFVGTWLDGGGGADAQENTAGSWGPSAFAVSAWADWENNTVQWNFYNFVSDLTAIGITGFDFEVATTGGNGGDPAIDLLGGEGTQPGWGGGSTSTDWQHYEFSTVPAPSALALLAMAGLARRRRS
ncbi:MAG: hypothetical protein QGI78_00760 [Phycisphaerales bacterium]|nr:hypothetical protein [Phycisphaerales bacterium]